MGLDVYGGTGLSSSGMIIVDCRDFKEGKACSECATWVILEIELGSKL